MKTLCCIVMIISVCFVRSSKFTYLKSEKSKGDDSVAYGIARNGGFYLADAAVNIKLILL